MRGLPLGSLRHTPASLAPPGPCAVRPAVITDPPSRTSAAVGVWLAPESVTMRLRPLMPETRLPVARVCHGLKARDGGTL